LWSFLLVLGLGASLPAPAAAAVTPGVAKYAGSYYIFVLNYQTFMQFGGAFKVDNTGGVTGRMFDANITLYPISGNIVNIGTTSNTTAGRFIINMINGANIYTVSVNLTSVGQLVGRQENPGAIFSLSGAKYNSFFSEAGTYYGNTDETPPHRVVFTIGLQRRISGTYEQIPVGSTISNTTGNFTYTNGNFTTTFGGANLAGYNGRSYLAKTFFNFAGPWVPVFSAGVPTHGTYRNASTAPLDPNISGNLTIYRITPTGPFADGNITGGFVPASPNFPPFVQTAPVPAP
jgi:hypothetical protein